MPKLTYRTKLPKPDDPEIIDAIYADVSAGIPLRYAAVRAGISEWTAYGWVDQAKAEIGDGAEPHGELGSVALFGQMVKEANAACVAAEVEGWNRGGKDWPAHATKLERRYPQDFGRNQRIEIDQRVTVTHRLELGSALADVLARIVELESPLELPEKTATAPEEN